MGVIEFSNQGLARLSKDQFDELTRIGGAPHDMVEEEGRLGVAFAKAGQVVAAWSIRGQGYFLQTPASFEAAKQILKPV